ncbi:hypothetical protein [Chryseobacterium sp. JV274]|uniref:hypothetical protein n=1 Tax=Chryseobacterium sp. JV274 TaxID=1932669 RepID=UPI0015C1FCEE|nr:hypothetical protein [Chryseobacterium sp. JV274]CAD0220322.1 conserved protein of unknown function [Chryseobacterium sp. JV274]
MEANELRIGNLTQDKVTKVVYSITANALLYLTACKEEDKEASIEPIPLTEDWILKFGFQIDQYVEIESLVDESGGWDLQLEIEYGERGTVICVSSDSLNQSLSIPLKHVKYVHQFQNLFFTLTGKELAINK